MYLLLHRSFISDVVKTQIYLFPKLRLSPALGEVELHRASQAAAGGHFLLNLIIKSTSWESSAPDNACMYPGQ